MISIVIPLYNKEDYIAETLRSVLAQTFTNFEVLVINDGSSDHSVDKVAAFNDERIQLHSIPNSGVSVARNTGIGLAKYEWIAFLDADDWWGPNFLSALVKEIETYPKALILASGRSRVFKEETERYSNEFLPSEGETGTVNYFQIISKYLPPINSSNVLLHTSLLKKDKFREGMRKHEDHDLWIRVTANNDIVFVNKPLSFYRKTQSNTASQHNFSAKDFERYLLDIKEVFQQLNETDKLFLQQYANAFIPISFFQNYGRYQKKERAQILHLSKSLVDTKRVWIMRMAHRFPWINLYKWYQFFKR